MVVLKILADQFYGLDIQDSLLMDTSREISKLKNRHWLKLDHMTSATLDLIAPELINIVFD